MKAIAVTILGVFGGFIVFGFLGLFIGPTLIAIMLILLQTCRLSGRSFDFTVIEIRLFVSLLKHVDIGGPEKVFDFDWHTRPNPPKGDVERHADARILGTRQHWMGRLTQYKMTNSYRVRLTSGNGPAKWAPGDRVQ